MRFRDRPLLADGIDVGLYLPRAELERAILDPLLVGRNVLLLGDAGAGKTTLMYRIASLLRESDRRSVWVNASVAETASDLLAEVEHALGAADDSPSDESPDPIGAQGLLAAARGLARHEPAVIMVDGLLDFEIGYDVFGRLRDELWAAGHAWLVALRPRDSAALRSPPAEAFWGAVVEIPPLDGDETERLLRLGLSEEEFRELDRDRIIAGAHPRLLIREAQARLTGTDDNMLDPAELTERAGSVGRSEAMAMAELIGLGRPASAHDPELLERLGWSRAYAQRILSRLESAHLLRAIPEREAERPGRPRKLYEPDPTVR